VQKPGGKVLKNLLESDFKGKVYAVNPKENQIQGVQCFQKVEDLPQTDCAILAIAAKYCPSSVDVLSHQREQEDLLSFQPFQRRKRSRSRMEKQVVNSINSVGGT
jgi:acetyltransferase